MTTPTTVNIRLQLRADTAANWAAANPTLLANEVGLETDTKKLKVGSGSTAWNSLAYFPSIVTGGTVLGNLEIGSTGTLTFEGSTADGFETTLAVTNPTADRTITLPNQSGTVVVSGNASIVNADIAANAEIAVSKLANGTANQVLVTDGTDVSWSDNLTLAGDLTVNGTTTTINTQDLLVEDKNIIIGNVTSPTDVTADGGGITLKGATDKTINWIDSTDAWTSSEHINIASGKEYRIAGTSVLTGTTLGSGITSSSLTSVGTLGSLTVTGATTAGTFIPTSGTAPSNGLYLPAANSVALSTNSSERVRITNGGLFKASDDGTYVSSAGGYHEFSNNASSGLITYFRNKGASSPLGVQITYSAASPNNTGSEFLYCSDSTAQRASIRSNGGIANYSGNNVNLSDINTKKDISPAADTWDCIKDWEIVNYRYKDQPDGANLNLGVIAQQVAESCPEVITVFEEAKDDQPEKLGVKEQQMYWMAIKALQEAQVRIEQLEAAVTALQQS